MAETVRLNWFGVWQDVWAHGWKFGGQRQKLARACFHVLCICAVCTQLCPPRMVSPLKRTAWRTDCYCIQNFLNPFRGVEGGLCVLGNVSKQQKEDDPDQADDPISVG